MVILDTWIKNIENLDLVSPHIKLTTKEQNIKCIYTEIATRGREFCHIFGHTICIVARCHMCLS